MTCVTSSIWISRVPIYFSYASTSDLSSTGLSPSLADFPKSFNYVFPLLSYRLFPFRSPLLRRSRLISFPLGTEMFQFPRFASHTFFSVGDTSFLVGFPIQIPPAHRSLPAPRGFSQASTSFFASYCLGIHLMRLFR